MSRGSGHTNTASHGPYGALVDRPYPEAGQRSPLVYRGPRPSTVLVWQPSVKAAACGFLSLILQAVAAGLPQWYELTSDLGQGLSVQYAGGPFHWRIEEAGVVESGTVGMFECIGSDNGGTGLNCPAFEAVQGMVVASTAFAGLAALVVTLLCMLSDAVVRRVGVLRTVIRPLFAVSFLASVASIVTFPVIARQWISSNSADFPHSSSMVSYAYGLYICGAGFELLAAILQKMS